MECRNKQPDYPMPDDQAAAISRLLARVQPTVTACLIVKNEAQNLGRCLESLKDFVDEIVVVDTGSTDETVAIAQSYGAIIGRFVWNDDFSAARNASLALATSDWVLVIDADETLDVDHEAWLLTLRNREPAGYTLLISDVDEQGRVVQESPNLRLVQRHDAFRFVKRIHESLTPSIQALGWPIYQAFGLRLRHTGYQKQVLADRDKLNRNVRLAEREAGEHPESAASWLNLARSYALAERWDEALATFERLAAEPGGLARLSDPLWMLYVTSLQSVYISLGRLQDAEAILSRGAERFPEIPEFRFDRGNVRYSLGDYAGAIADFESCLKTVGRPFSPIMRNGVTDVLPREALRQIREAHPEAFETAPRSQSASERDALLAQLRENPRDAESFLGLAMSFYQEELLDKALLAVGQSIELNAGRPAAYHLLGLILCALGQPGWAEKAFATVLQLDPDHPSARQSRMECRNQPAAYPMPEDQAAVIARLLSRVQPTVTACMIVKNEAKNLARCLESVKDYVDEIVVMDTGSTDETVAIAQSYGAKVGHFTWIDDFSAARNASLALATSDWVLAIDADDQLVMKDHEAWMAALRNREPAAYMIDIVDVEANGESVHPFPRLFQRHEAIRYDKPLHEDITASVARLGWKMRLLSAASFRHDGYSPATAQAKGGRNLQLALKAVEADPGNVKGWYELGRASVVLGQDREALDIFAQVQRLIDEGRVLPDPSYSNYVLLHQTLLARAGRHDQAIALLTRGLAEVPGYPEFLFERGRLRAQAGDIEGARADFEACMAPPTRVYLGYCRVGITDALPRRALAELQGR
jgi:glycosyltransferase involved in cell wall biosynthesis